MKPIPRAVAIGVLCEAALAATIPLGGIGPCGPTSPLGFIAMMLHLFPGLALAAVLESAIKLPGFAYVGVVVVSQCLLWIAISYVVICARSRRRT